MPDKKDCMTMEQAEQKMECLREVFSIVRLVDGEMLEKRAEHSADADAMEMCQCYSFWNKAKPCENCISMKSLDVYKRQHLNWHLKGLLQTFIRNREMRGLLDWICCRNMSGKRMQFWQGIAGNIRCV